MAKIRRQMQDIIKKDNLKKTIRISKIELQRLRAIEARVSQVVFEMGTYFDYEIRPSNPDGDIKRWQKELEK